MSGYEGGTALLVVDVQNDFADPSGSLYVRGGDLVVPLVNDQIALALEAGATVVYTQDWHPEVRDDGERALARMREVGAVLEP